MKKTKEDRKSSNILLNKRTFSNDSFYLSSTAINLQNLPFAKIQDCGGLLQWRCDVSRQLCEDILVVDKLICILSRVPGGNDDFAFHDRKFLLPVHQPECTRYSFERASFLHLFAFAFVGASRARCTLHSARSER